MSPKEMEVTQMGRGSWQFMCAIVRDLVVKAQGSTVDDLIGKQQYVSSQYTLVS